MRIVFMGTPEFAVPSLQMLLDHHYDVAGVITSPDKLGGRGKKTVLRSAIKQYAVQKQLNILQPKNLKSPEFIEKLKSIKADLQIVVAFRMLPELVWNMPPHGTFNLHGSLLPKYRGAAPINWAVINGETETGVTTFKLKHDIDTGDMLLQEKIPVYFTDDAGNVHDRMKQIGAKLILETVTKLESGDLNVIKQDETLVSSAPKINFDLCEIDFDQETYKIYNFIRGLSPYPGAWAKYQGKILKIYKSEFEIKHHNFEPGKILKSSSIGMRISAKDGFILPKFVQMEGRKKMSVDEFLMGSLK